ncbi:hypothetical protein ACWGID_02185 [Kribbella sp. NPDC054772]
MGTARSTVVRRVGAALVATGALAGGALVAAEPAAAGTNVCAQLWRHKPGGGYDSWGLPCDTM